jgi:hypothetical protein
MDPSAGVVVGGWPDVWRDVDAADRYTNEQPASLAGADLSEQITVGVSLSPDLRLCR